jgi:hypothetical protein
MKNRIYAKSGTGVIHIIDDGTKTVGDCDLALKDLKVTKRGQYPRMCALCMRADNYNDGPYPWTKIPWSRRSLVVRG